VQINPKNGFETEKEKNGHRTPGCLPPPPTSPLLMRMMPTERDDSSSEVDFMAEPIVIELDEDEEAIVIKSDVDYEPPVPDNDELPNSDNESSSNRVLLKLPLL